MNLQQEQIATRRNEFLLIIGVMLIATTLRVPLTSVGPLIPDIRETLGLHNVLAGFITTLPLLAFAFFSPITPKIANKVGIERTIGYSLLVLLIGMILRSSTGVAFLLFGTLLIGLAIAVGNVLIPAYIKMNFPLKIGLMTGFYAVFMNIFGALGSGLSVPIAEWKSFGWQGSLLIWAVLVFIALLLWLPQWRRNRTEHQVDTKQEKTMNLWHSKVAWAVTLFMGGQSLGFYTAITWLPELFQNLSYSATGAGWLIFLMQVSLIPTTFIVPVFAERAKSQVPFAVGTAFLFMISFGLLFLPFKALAPIIVLLLGVACGSGFSLSMMFFSLRTNTGIEAAELSGMAQSVGYLFAAIGPVFVGLLYDLQQSWTVPLIFLIIVSIIIGLAGISAGKDTKVA